MTVTAPTLLSAQPFQGFVPAVNHGSISWSDDGQVMYVFTRGVKILTPYLVASRPPPTSSASANTNAEDPTAGNVNTAGPSRAAGMGAAEGSGTTGADAGAASKKGKGRARNKVAELSWFINNVDQRDRDREGRYQWANVGDESSQVISVDEVDTREAVWSPSGLADSGGCMLGVMSSRGQVSIYAPTKDPSSTKWEEVADITYLTGILLGESLEKPPSVKSVLRMRSTSMAWSRKTKLRQTVGHDSSLLAIGNRAGQISLWRYGPEKRFERETVLNVSRQWINKIAWSEWTSVDDTTSASTLAVVSSDGDVTLITIQRKLETTGGASDPVSRTEILGMQELQDGDRRVTTAITWLNTGILVIARAGTVAFWSSDKARCSWSGLHRIVLPQLGNWAGANPFNACIGITSIDDDNLIVSLSSQVHYFIKDITNQPALAPLKTSLNLSISARQLFLDSAGLNMFVNRGSAEMDPKARLLTMHTGGLAGLGEGGVLSWMGDIVNFTDLYTTTEANRQHTFFTADMGDKVPGRRPIIDELEQLLDTPPDLLQHAPLKALMPHIMRISASRDVAGIASEVADLISGSEEPEARTDATPSAGDENLRSVLWGSKDLNGSRLKYVLALWCERNLKQTDLPFGESLASTLRQIRQDVHAGLARWMSSLSLNGISGDDLRFASHIAKVCPESGLRAGLVNAPRQPFDVSDRCPACGEVIEDDGSDVGRCPSGHEWSRCSVTGYLLLTANYRVCSVCPAASLMPARYAGAPISVAADGKTRDDARLARPALTADREARKEEGWVVEEALEAAVVCLLCAGRWVRAM